MNATATDYKKVLTEVLQKQIVILGPAITLAKARHVDGIDVADDGSVMSLSADGHAVSVKVLEQFRELSPLLVKKTMKPLLRAILYETASPVSQDASPPALSQPQTHDGKEMSPQP